MWLVNSTVGRKVIMSITGLFLILFLTFHVLMNAVAIFSPEGYDVICHFLGANWYALVGTMVLAAGFVIHIIFAFWLTLQNLKARGKDAYDVSKKPKSVEWASQNMLVLGIIVLAFLVIHMMQFWYRMQLQEIMGTTFEGMDPAKGSLFLNYAFKDWWTLVIYLIGFGALWFHMTHGFWSAFQSLGTNGDKWLIRLKKISMWWATAVCLLFAVEAVVFTLRANCPECNPQITCCHDNHDHDNCGTTHCTTKCDNAECESKCGDACTGACEGKCDELCVAASAVCACACEGKGGENCACGDACSCKATTGCKENCKCGDACKCDANCKCETEPCGCNK